MRTRNPFVTFPGLRSLGLPDTLEQLFDGVASRQDGQFVPRVEVREDAQGYTVRAEVPGVAPEDVDVRLTGDTLTIKGEKQEEVREESETVQVSERSYGTFERSFTLGAPVEAQGVEAESKDGVLIVRVPKAQEAKSHRVEIKKG